MITKNQTKSLYYLDRDTNLDVLVDDILRVKKSEIIVFLQRKKIRLQEKEAGEYFTIEDVLRVKEGELENMQRFFRGAVVPYFVRQKYNIWTESIDHGLLVSGTEELKKMVGFVKYDHTGHLTDEVNSMSTFNRVKDLVEFLNMVEVVCFDDDGFIFPDSDKFKKLSKEKGRDIAKRQVFIELYEKVKNKYYKREITD